MPDLEPYDHYLDRAGIPKNTAPEPPEAAVSDLQTAGKAALKQLAGGEADREAQEKESRRLARIQAIEAREASGPNF